MVATTRESMGAPAEGWLRAGTVEEVQRRGAVVVGGVLVVVADGKLRALDNRCPHMGFPLSRGTVCDGILTCHWHHARFDLATGGTFDPFADDVAVHDLRVVDGVVWVGPRPRQTGDRAATWAKRLEDGLEQNLSLVLVKSVLGLTAEEGAGRAARRAVLVGGLFGTRQRAAGWGPGLTILTAMANVLDALTPDDQPLALFHGLSHVADDCAGQPTRFQLDPLPTSEIEPDRLKSWFRQFIAVRNAEGAERVLLTAIDAGQPAAWVSDMLVAAATDHVYLNGGHTLDFVNKAFELLELVGWDRAAEVLPSLVGGMARAARSEEQNSWRSPVDLVELARPSLERLESERLPVSVPGAGAWNGFDGLVETVLGEDPGAIVAALDRAWADGAQPDEVGLALAYAAAMRVTRFPTSNEYGDWIAVLHTFTYCNALHRSLKRAASAEAARGLYHGALRIYLDRFLNVPAARLPDGRAPAPTDLRAEMLDLLDRQQQVEPAARLVDAHLRAGGTPAELFSVLGSTLLREDAEFHTYQMYEAGTRVYAELAPTRPDAARHVAVAVARYLASHAPTARELRQTARIAVRLQRGDDLSQPDPAEDVV